MTSLSFNLNPVIDVRPRWWWCMRSSYGRMKTARFLAVAALCMLPCACTSPKSARTYADLEVAVVRMQADYSRSQLTEHPQQNCITRDLRYKLFFQLPLEERAVVVLDSFANASLDGELAFMMSQMLRCRTQAAAESQRPQDTDGRAYAVALFRAIEGYSEAQVRRFCGDEAHYRLFRRNLRRWKENCLFSAEQCETGQPLGLSTFLS